MVVQISFTKANSPSNEAAIQASTPSVPALTPDVVQMFFHCTQRRRALQSVFGPHGVI